MTEDIRERHWNGMCGGDCPECVKQQRAEHDEAAQRDAAEEHYAEEIVPGRGGPMTDKTETGVEHVHRESGTCRCSIIADEPTEDCPVHGHPWPPRCAACGQMMKWPR
jgi:hypothetical protein